MSDERVELNLAPSVQRLVKGKFPGLRVGAPTINVLGKCADEFLRMVVQSSAEVCEENNVNTMIGKHVLTSLETLGFERFTEQMKEKDEAIGKKVNDRKQLMQKSRVDDMTLEEGRELMRQLREADMAKRRERNLNRAREKQAEKE